MNGYHVLVDGTRYVVQAETAALAQQRARDTVGAAAQRIDAARPLSDAELPGVLLRQNRSTSHPAGHAPKYGE